MRDLSVAVVGMGYVGLPLALAFGRVMPTIGFDVVEEKIAAYKDGYDPTGEMEKELFIRADRLRYSTNPTDISDADFIVVAVPTPVDNAHQPDLTPVVEASKTVGQQMKKGSVVIFESTVYPGVTEEVCVPILEKESGLKCGEGFKVGYSPERVNPGDKVHRLETIVKVVSGQDEETLDKVAALYEQVIEAGVHRAPTIKVAEAAKVIENTQRDVNIALINELALIFHKLNIDTLDVLEAAGSKWNFLPFRPGLVGGHCIGVDPYYLTHRAEIEGFRPEIIKAARRINDGMGRWIAEQTVIEMIRAGVRIKGARVGVLGLTFKEDCADLRNTKVIDCIRELKSLGIEVLVHDPIASADDAEKEYQLKLSNWEDIIGMDALVIAVAHSEYKKMSGANFSSCLHGDGIVMDVKSFLTPELVKSEPFHVWRL